MEGAYFVGRIELLNWLNTSFGFAYAKVEQCCSGAAYCQILDAIYPGEVALHRVKFDANLEYQWVANYKVLQSAFDKVGLKKYIDVQKLTRGRYQDNLEFLQWFKRYYDLEYNPDSNYNATERRAQCAAKISQATPAHRQRVPRVACDPSASARPARPVARTKGPKPRTSLMPSSSGTTSSSRKQPLHQRNSKGNDSHHSLRAEVTKQQKEIAALQSKVKKMEKDEREKEASMSHLRVIAQGLEQERDFYFQKLQEVEKLFQDKDEADPFVASVLNVLYQDGQEVEC